MEKFADHTIVFDDVSKFYGEILGVNRVTLAIEPGITSLVGPNGSGKTTLMNLMTGLIRPTRGRVSVLGLRPDHPEVFFNKVGYCSQFDSFPNALTGFQFISSYLRVHGRPKKRPRSLRGRRSIESIFSKRHTARSRPTARACASASDLPRP